MIFDSCLKLPRNRFLEKGNTLQLARAAFPKGWTVREFVANSE